jgi:geranylgeranyl pyrophosphate synthase
MSVLPLSSRPYVVPDEPAGLRSLACMADVESLMTRLAVGTRLARSGMMVQEHLSTGGKRVRARLALAAYEAIGGPRENAVPWASACELLHNATLVHDDIQDGDTMRRDAPTTWVRHGVAQAINAGDLMLMLPYVALEQLRADGETRWRLTLAAARAAEATVRGQSAEMEMLSARRIAWDDWLRAVEGKTGAFLGLPVEGAALLAGLDQRTASRFGQEFAQLGVLFQLQDDLIDLTDAKGRGRRGSDLYEGKVSALVVEHLALWPDEAPWLLELLETPRDATPPEQVERAMHRFYEGGAVNAVKARAARYADAVHQSPLLRAVPDLHAVARELVALMDAKVAHASRGAR